MKAYELTPTCKFTANLYQIDYVSVSILVTVMNTNRNLNNSLKILKSHNFLNYLFRTASSQRNFQNFCVVPASCSVASAISVKIRINQAIKRAIETELYVHKPTGTI